MSHRPVGDPARRAGRPAHRGASRGCPGVGPKTAQRLTYHLLRAPGCRGAHPGRGARRGPRRGGVCDDASTSAPARGAPSASTRPATTPACAWWRSPSTCSRSSGPGAYRGRYHVLQGAISPMDGDRARPAAHPRAPRSGGRAGRPTGEPFEEVVLATNPTLEGEATAMYLAERLAGHVGSVTRIARGIPVGGDLEYADEVTLVRALQGRRELEVAASRSATDEVPRQRGAAAARQAGRRAACSRSCLYWSLTGRWRARVGRSCSWPAGSAPRRSSCCSRPASSRRCSTAVRDTSEHWPPADRPPGRLTGSARPASVPPVAPVLRGWASGAQGPHGLPGPDGVSRPFDSLDCSVRQCAARRGPTPVEGCTLTSEEW